MNIKKIFCIIITLLSVALISSCSAGTPTSSTEPDSSQPTSQPISQSASEVSSSTSAPEEPPAFSAIPQNIETVDFSSEQNALKCYIKFARSEIKKRFLDGDECMITLRNVFGNEKPEMIIAIKKSQSPYANEYYFSTDENDEPIYLGVFLRSMSYFDSDTALGLYMDSANTYYYITFGSHKDNVYWMEVDRFELTIKSKAAPDFAEYQNSDALDFVNNTHMGFIRYDNRDYDDEKDTWKNPEELAAMFYYEDSGLYEAYSVSKQMLDLTAFEIKDYINDEGNHIYSYLPGENYLVSRREYEQIKSGVFEKLTKVTNEPVISSGWIDIDDVYKWLDSLG